MTTTASELPFGINLGSRSLFQRGEEREAFRRLRHEAPVHWNPGTDRFNGFWSLVKYDDILHVSRHPEIFISSKGFNIDSPRQPVQVDDLDGVGNLLQIDPPRHVKMRRLVNKGFTPRAVNAMEPGIREMANDVLDQIAGRDSCDFVVEASSQLPLAVICGLMGIEREDWPVMFDLTNYVLGAADPEYQARVAPPEQVGTYEGGIATVRHGRTRMLDYFRETLDRRRKEPLENDLITILLESEVDGDRLTEDEILDFCTLLVTAGNETTRNAISGGLAALCENPDQREALLADPSLIDSAVEEILRWSSPVTHMAREAIEDVEIRGQQIKAGERIVMWYPSANRDEDVFEDAERFDIRRSPNEHLAFGIGEHFCLGAGFARKEIKVMFQELLRRFPDIDLDGPPERLRSNFIGGIKHLPVRYTPER